MTRLIIATLSLSIKQLGFLEKEATRLGITVSDLIRRIIDHYRDTKGTPKSKSFPSQLSLKSSHGS